MICHWGSSLAEEAVGAGFGVACGIRHGGGLELNCCSCIGNLGVDACHSWGLTLSWETQSSFDLVRALTFAIHYLSIVPHLQPVDHLDCYLCGSPKLLL